MSVKQAQDMMAAMQQRIRKDLGMDSGALAGFTDTHLLAELIRRRGVQAAPTSVKLLTPHSVADIAIGKDFTATIVIDDEAFEELKKYELS